MQLCFNNSRGEILVANSSSFFFPFPRETLQTLVLPRRYSTLKLLVVSTHQQLFIKCAKRRETHRWREHARPPFFAVNHWVEGEERHTYLYVQESRVRVQDSPLLGEFPTAKINEHCVAENPICSSKTKPAKLGAIRLRKQALEEEGGAKGKKHPFHRFLDTILFSSSSSAAAATDSSPQVLLSTFSSLVTDRFSSVEFCMVEESTAAPRCG